MRTTSRDCTLTLVWFVDMYARLKIYNDQLLFFFIFFSGWIFDETGSYTASFLVLSAVSLLCLFLQFILDIQNFVNDTVIYHKVLEEDPDHLTITK